MPDFHTVRPEQLELYFQRLFKIGDRDGNGVLDSLEFRDVLRKSKFMFDNETISRILVAADTNRDGVIQYSEFLPAMRALFQKINPVQGQKHVHNAHTREAITAEYEAGIPSHPSVVAKMQRHAPAPVQGHHFLDAQGAWDPHFGSHHLEAPDPTYWQEHNLKKKGIETILNHHHKQQYGVDVPGARLGNPSHQRSGGEAPMRIHPSMRGMLSQEPPKQPPQQPAPAPAPAPAHESKPQAEDKPEFPPGFHPGMHGFHPGMGGFPGQHEFHHPGMGGFHGAYGAPGMHGMHGAPSMHGPPRSW